MPTIPNSPLKPKTQSVLAFIKKYVHENGLAPTCQEIAEGVPLSSKSVAHNHIKKLVAEEYLYKRPGRAGGLVLLAPRPSLREKIEGLAEEYDKDEFPHGDPDEVAIRGVMADELRRILKETDNG
jgi:SOS-response transcriptional repressor LexA